MFRNDKDIPIKHTSLPPVGFGTCEIHDEEVILEALKCGYRLIDTASHYFNEKIVGEGIRKSGVTRSEIIVTSKVWYSDMGYDQTLRAFEKSAAALGGDIDMYLIHWPAEVRRYPDWEKTNIETWRALERLYKENRVKIIGTCNFMRKHYESLLKYCEIRPMINQIEFHPGFMQTDTVSCCRENQIVIEAWGPLGNGEIIRENAIIQKTADKLSKTKAQICIRWCFQHGIIPIPKTTKRQRMQENLDISGFEIDKDDMREIDNMPFCGGAGAQVK